MDCRTANKAGVNAVRRIVKEARLSKGLTQDKVSREAGMTAAQYSQFECGRTGINLGTFLSVLNALNLKMVIKEKEQTP